MGQRGNYNRDKRIADGGGYTVRTVMQGTHYVPSPEYHARQAMIQQDMRDYFTQQYQARDDAIKRAEEEQAARDAEQARLDAVEARKVKKRAQVLKRVQRHRLKAHLKKQQEKERQYVYDTLKRKQEIHGNVFPMGVALDFQKLGVDPDLIAEIATELGIEVWSQDNCHKHEGVKQ